MKQVFFGIQLVIYLFYTFMLFFSLMPAARASIQLSQSKSYPIVAYCLVLLPYLAGCYLLYKSYSNISDGAFWLYCILSLLIPIVLVPVLLLMMG